MYSSEITDDQRQVWASADLARLAAQHVLAHELLARTAEVHHGQRVLDVGAGAGNAAIAAARRGAEVTAIDPVAEFLAVAEQRAHGDGLTLTTRVAHAQDLPFPDAGFDVVLSTFAVIFAPDAHRAAAELVRVCRPGGRIGLTAWTPLGFVGQTVSTLARYQSRPGGTDPLKWGDQQWLRRLLDGPLTDLRIQTRTVDLCYPSADQAIESQRRTLGPVRATFDALDSEGRHALTADMKQVIARFNTATDGTVIAPAEYLEILATKEQESAAFSAEMERQATQARLRDQII